MDAGQRDDGRPLRYDEGRWTTGEGRWTTEGCASRMEVRGWRQGQKQEGQRSEVRGQMTERQGDGRGRT